MTEDKQIAAAQASATRPEQKLGHIRALDGVRGVAYLLVLGHHCFGVAFHPSAWPASDRLLNAFFSYGYLGVDLFFVLSGYLITTLLLLDRKNPHYYRNFYLKRAFRILPALLAVIVVCLSARLMSPAYALLCIFFIAGFTSLFHVRADGPFWSLAVEEQFYLLWPMAVRKSSIRRLRQFLLLIIILEPFIRLLMVEHRFPYYIISRCDGIAWGALLATESRLRRLLEHRKGAGVWWRRCGRWILAAGCVLFFAGVAFQFAGPRPMLSVQIIFTAAPMFFVGLIAYLLTHHQAFVTAVFRNPVLRFFGNISYCSYLLHFYVIQVYDRLVGPLREGDTGAFLLRGFAVAAVTTLICTASLYWFERPVMGLRKRFLA